VKLVIEKAAARRLRMIPRKVAEAIMANLEAIAADPFGRHPQAKALKGTKSGFCLRHGGWRALYRVDRAAETVYVEAMKSRGGAYR